MSVDDYITLDDISKEARYEYLDGELLMLAGGSNDHSIIAANLSGDIWQILTYKRDATIDLPYLGLQIPVSRLYKKTRLLQQSL